jgi:hypothetical protein
MRIQALPILLLSATALLSACEKPGAWGDVNGLIIASSPEAWEVLEDTVETVLAPTVLTVRDERTFRVTPVDPLGGDWGNLRRFVQMVAIGSQADPWIAEALERRRDETPLSPPQLLQVYDVWARGQQVTVLLVEEGRWDQVTPMLGQVQQILDEQFRQWARNRMFMSGADTLLERQLMAEAGFSILVPEVYDWESRNGIYRFRNDNPDPSELIREIVVSWRSPIPQEELGREYLLEWRAARVEEAYTFPQVVADEGAVASPGSAGGLEAYQVQAIWENPPEEFPAAGPFLLRGVKCPEQDRLYLLDAWLYAPGKEKYEYMLQLETILDSFRCGS